MVFLLLLACKNGGGGVVLDDTGSGGGGEDGPALSVDPTSLEFPVVFAGGFASDTVTATNTGDVALALSATMVSDDEGAWTVAVADPALDPGESTEITLTLTAATWGNYDATLQVKDDAAGVSGAVAITARVQQDEDGDGYGSTETGGGDCDDANATVHPEAEDAWYDGEDTDCAGNDDYDQDADGHASDAYGGDDCDDAVATTYPGATDDWYDGVDADCAGDDDYDQDKDGDPTVEGGGGDCDDTDASISSGATETWYDGVDADCDGASDYDQDGDGHDYDDYGGDDCDDTNPDAYSGAGETWYNDVDNNCDGGDDWDQDGDGTPYPTDCSDTDPTTTGPSAETWNGNDDDCDGLVDDFTASSVAGGTLYGATSSLALGTQSGTAFAGDITDDGDPDIVLVSSTSSNGYAYLVAGADALGVSAKVTDVDSATVGGSSSYRPLANVYGASGDPSGDGVADLIVTGTSTSTYRGTTYVLEGGSISATSTSSADFSFTGDSDSDMARWGEAGDFDGDGDDDFVLGSAYDNYSTGSWSGGNTASGNLGFFEAGSFSGEYDLGDAADEINGDNSYDYLGWAMAVADVDGDGYDDVIAGAPGLDDGASGGGGVYILDGDASLSWSSQIGSDYAALVAGDTASGGIGADAIPMPGDLDGDGTLDLAFSDSSVGKVWIFWDISSMSGDYVASDADVIITGTASSFATSIAVASDLDGDGADDLAVGASGDDNGASNAGAVWIYDDVAGLTTSATTSNANHVIVGVNADDNLGAGLAAGADVDGDGLEDLLLGATGNDTKATNGGAVYVFLGR